MLRSALLIFSGNSASSLLLLVRNLMVARLVPVEDYGIASTFAIVMAVIEMVSNFGLQQQIIQARDGDDPDFQAALQGFQLLRGVFSGLLLFACAGALADFMNFEGVAGAYQVMALVPVLNALQHFDIHRLNRHMIFGPLIVAGTMPALVSLVLVWPLALWLGDYRVMLYAILAQAVMGVVFTHLMAERPWRMTLERAVIARALRFGWPLMLNNVLLFVVFNGDRILIGREMGAAELAIFSMGLTLTLTPTLVFARSMQNLFLPRLSALDPRGTDAARFSGMATAVLEIVLLASLLFAVGTVLLGRPVVYLLLGEKYLPLLPYIGLFAIAQALRMLKIGPAIAALATGHTGNAMIGNLPRLVSLPLVWWLAATTGDVFSILLLMILAEGTGCLLALLVLARQVPLARPELALCYLLAAPCLAAAAWVSFHGTDPAAPAAPGAVLWLMLGLSMVPSLLAMRSLRQRLSLLRGK